MDEQTLKVLARFTEIGQYWPQYVWVWNNGEPLGEKRWYQCKSNTWKRYSCELSEVEANQLGFHKEDDPIAEPSE